MWLFSIVLFTKLIYFNTNAVAGWSEAEMFMLIGTFSTLRGFTDTLFYRNLSDLPEQMRLGTMDFVLLKPVNSQFYMSLRYVAIDNIGQFAAAIGMLAYGLSQLHQSITVPGVLAYLFLLACAVLLFYSISTLAMTLSFWLIRVENLFVALDTVYSMGRTPIDVFRAFGPVAPFILTYILPIAFFAAMPVKALFGRLPLADVMLGGAAISAFFFACSVMFWRYATRSYASASS
jgi:ABC-2 type transport system permease protein